jgi:hypothetical protein
MANSAEIAMHGGTADVQECHLHTVHHLLLLHTTQLRNMDTQVLLDHRLPQAPQAHHLQLMDMVQVVATMSWNKLASMRPGVLAVATLLGLAVNTVIRTVPVLGSTICSETFADFERLIQSTVKLYSIMSI